LPIAVGVEQIHLALTLLVLIAGNVFYPGAAEPKMITLGLINIY
jgi:hypothetical protein